MEALTLENRASFGERLADAILNNNAGVAATVFVDEMTNADNTSRDKQSAAAHVLDRTNPKPSRNEGGITIQAQHANVLIHQAARARVAAQTALERGEAIDVEEEAEA